MLEQFGLFAAIAGLLTTFVMAMLKKASTAIDAMPAFTKQIVVVVIAAVMVFVTKFTGIELPGDINSWTPEMVTTLITAAIAMAYHAIVRGFKRDEPDVNV